MGPGQAVLRTGSQEDQGLPSPAEEGGVRGGRRCEGKKAPELSWGKGILSCSMHASSDSQCLWRHLWPVLLGSSDSCQITFPVSWAPSYLCGRKGVAHLGSPCHWVMVILWGG